MAIRYFHSFVGKTIHCEPHPINFTGEIYATEDEKEIAALCKALDVVECDGSLNSDKENEDNIRKEKEKAEKAAKKEQEKAEREAEKAKEAEEKKAAEDAKAVEGAKHKDDKKTKVDDTVASLGDGNDTPVF